MNDYYVGELVYRIVTWADHPRQDHEFCIIKSNAYVDNDGIGGDWEDVAGYDTLEEVETHLKKLGVKL